MTVVNKQPITLRPLRESDMEFLLDLYAMTRNDILQGPWSFDQKQALIRSQFEAQHLHYQAYFRNARFDVVLLEAQRIGRLYVDRSQDEFRLIDIAILPEHRGQGIGSTLVRELMDEAANIQRPIRLRVEPDNPALRWYQRLGFRVIADEQVNFHMQWDSPRPDDD